ncbi:MAG: amidohydrolase family protein, partial [Proteobacteria bacterium]|nr:amidohydrolase family protein [Pseudomonadota bacterium]
DAHVHVTATMMDLRRNAEEPLSLTTARSIPIMKAMLGRGFTTVRDAGGADWGLAAAVESGLLEGPRLLFSGHALSQTGGHGDMRPRVWSGDSCACCVAGAEMAIVVDGVPAVQKAAREQLRTGASQIKIMASGGVASPDDPVDNLQFSADEISAIVWEAQSWHRYVMAHAYTAEAIERIVRLGVRSIEHANLIDNSCAETMVEFGAFMVPTLITYEVLFNKGREWGMPQVSIDKLDYVRDAGLRSLEIARVAGVKMGFGTDLLGEGHDFQSGEFARRAEVLTPLEIIRSATLGNAELFQREGELGTVAPGAYADIIAIDGNPLEDISLLGGQGEHLALIMKGGVVYKDGLGD